MRTLMTLALIARMTDPIYLRGEEIYLALEVSNSGSQPVEIGQPVITGHCCYTLTTPEGQELAESGRVWLHPSVPDSVRGKKPEPISVTPDVRWSGCVDLAEHFDFETNGRYRLQVSCGWDQIHLESEPLEFQVEDLEVLQVSRASSHGGTSLVFLRKTEKGRDLLYSRIEDVHDECGFRGFPEVAGPHLLRSLSGEAVDPVYASENPSSTDLRFNFWREGNALCWTYVSHNKKMPLPGTVDRLLDPALQNGKTGVTHVYALSSKEGVARLVVVRVMAYLKAGYKPEVLLAEVPLGASPLGGAAEIDMVRGRLHRSVALGGMHGEAPRVDWMSYEGDAVPEKLRSHVWTTSPAAEAIPDARPAILASKDGGVRIAWLAREKGRPEQGLFCEATFDASGALQGESVTAIEAKSPILAARTLYSEGAPAVALWTEDGGVQAGPPAGLKRLERPGKRRVTPTLLVHREDVLVLDIDPLKGLVLLPIESSPGKRR